MILATVVVHKRAGAEKYWRAVKKNAHSGCSALHILTVVCSALPVQLLLKHPAPAMLSSTAVSKCNFLECQVQGAWQGQWLHKLLGHATSSGVHGTCSAVTALSCAQVNSSNWLALRKLVLPTRCNVIAHLLLALLSRTHSQQGSECVLLCAGVCC